MSELKPGWTRVHFGEVVRLGKERCANPLAEGIERFIGLEHLEPGDLRVRTWGNVEDGTTFTTRVRPGQVLFGKRRAYQRKVAVSDFDAVCSGDIYVFESTNPKRLMPELLPFLCQTETFFEHAVGTSAGSLSPRTNWSSLSEYEFALPPLEEQVSMVALLLLQAAVVFSQSELELRAIALRDAALAFFFPDGAEGRRLETWCNALITYGIVQAGPHVEGGVPYIRVSDMTSGPELSKFGMLCTSKEIASRFKRSEVRAGDIVVALRGPVGLPRIVPPELDGANLTQGTARVSLADDAQRDYVFWALQAPSARREMASHSKGSTFSELTLEALRQIPIAHASREIQLSASVCLEEIAASQTTAANRLNEAQTALRISLNSLLDGSAQ